MRSGEIEMLTQVVQVRDKYMILITCVFYSSAGKIYDVQPSVTWGAQLCVQVLNQPAPSWVFKEQRRCEFC